MPISIVTKQLKDASDQIFVMQCIDRSGTGAGPFVPFHVIGTADGANVLDLEALNTALVAAIGESASLLDGDLDAILAKLPGDPATGARQDMLVARLGEVQASPTANTVLDRLKVIATNVAAVSTGLSAVVLAAGTAVIGKVIAAGPDYQASGVVAVTGTLSASDNSSSFIPKAGRQAYLTLSGGTSLLGVLQVDFGEGAGFAPIEVEGVQLGAISYSGTTKRIKLTMFEQAGVSLRLAASAVSGNVNYSFTQ